MKTNAQTGLEALKQLRPLLSEITDWNAQTIHERIFAEIEKTGVKNGYMLWPLRVALSGKAVTPCGGIELAAILGKTETLDRIDAAIEKLS